MAVFYDTVFEAIEDFIFSRRYQAPTVEQETPPPIIAPMALAPATTMSTPLGSPPLVPLLGQVDIEAILAREAEGKDLDWQGSVADLLKLCGVNPTVENRRSLAEELDVADNGDDEALYAAVMRELEDRGGLVPAELKS
ncbi:hypothetical protein ABI_05540 [Asticcacaulis biprosthecium C19]|uniref:DUF3597 domain-containing protein n=1 Tax=Asticcacaulis biprosthecium C19 TaxID=715226 RepID=F4QKG9_9CAUL|nr:DUF3597 family protein [Asticcacaulis biprosthecium]EGF92121.1 hypothetical protein ABI_05540 [Asticcacaulis biprosthecium C19]